MPKPKSNSGGVSNGGSIGAKLRSGRIVGLPFVSPKKPTTRTSSRIRKPPKPIFLVDRECKICSTPTVKALLAPRCSRHCTYSSVVCLECVNKHVMTQCSTSFMKPLGCLVCGSLVTPKHLTKVLNRMTFDKYEEAEVRKYMLLNNARHCPAKDCTGTFLVEDGTCSVVACPQCKLSFCASCSEVHGAEITCADAAKGRSPDDAMNLEWKHIHTKRCPKCDAKIEKNGGCNNMTCSRCTTQFQYDQAAS